MLTAEQRRRYHDTSANQAGLEAHVARLRAAEALVVQFPTWCYGPPAMLKGFLDRMLMPGVAFDLTDPASVRPLLHEITRLAGIVTYGRSRLAAWGMGDPPRKLVTRYLRWFIAPGARIDYLAQYGLNVATDRERARFLNRVGRAMAHL